MNSYYLIGFIDEPDTGIMDYSNASNFLHLTVLPRFSLPLNKVDDFSLGVESITKWFPPLTLEVSDHEMFGEEGNIPVALVSSSSEFSLHDLHSATLDVLVRSGGWGNQEYFMDGNYAPHVSYYTKWAPLALFSLSLVRHSGDKGEIVENLRNFSLEGESTLASSPLIDRTD